MIVSMRGSQCVGIEVGRCLFSSKRTVQVILYVLGPYRSRGFQHTRFRYLHFSASSIRLSLEICLQLDTLSP